jgi:hypothetical protein
MNKTLCCVVISALTGLGCGGADVTTGAWAEFAAELTFAGSTYSITQTVDPDIRPEVSEISASVICGSLDLSESNIALRTFQGAEDAPFQLRATLIDGATELTLFDWSASLQSNAKSLSFTNDNANVNQDAVEKIEEILIRPVKSYQVRYDFSAESAPASVLIEVSQLIRVATETSMCPASVAN